MLVYDHCSAVWAADTHLYTTRPYRQWCQFLNCGCLNVTLHIVDLRQYYVWCARSGVTRCTFFMVLYLSPVCAGEGYMRCCDRTSVDVCACSLQNSAVPQDYYSSISISVERSWWPRIRWCGTGGFQVHGQNLFILIAARFCVSYCLSFLWLHFFGWYCVAGVFGLTGC